MIASMITLGLQAVMPLVSWFVKNAEKKQEIKDTMYKMIEAQCAVIVRNNNLRKQYDQMKVDASNSDVTHV